MKLALAVFVAFLALLQVSGTPPETWKKTADDQLPDGLILWRSPDSRCNLAIASHKDSGADSTKLTEAFESELEESGFKLTGSKFARGQMAGRYQLDRRGDTTPPSWEVRACFFRKRDENVCQSSCENLL